MITSMRWCVAHNDFWHWPISSRSFSHEFAIKLLKYVISCRVRCAVHTFLGGFFLVGHKWSLPWEGVSYAMTFDLDLYLQGYLAVILHISWIISICGTNTTHDVSRTIARSIGQSQGHTGPLSFCCRCRDILVDHWSAISGLCWVIGPFYTSFLDTIFIREMMMAT